MLLLFPEFAQGKVIFRAAYGSQRHLSLYKELGLQPDQVFIHGRGGRPKKSSGVASSEGKDFGSEDDCQVCSGTLQDLFVVSKMETESINNSEELTCSH